MKTVSAPVFERNLLALEAEDWPEFVSSAGQLPRPGRNTYGLSNPVTYQARSLHTKNDISQQSPPSHPHPPSQVKVTLDLSGNETEERAHETLYLLDGFGTSWASVRMGLLIRGARTLDLVGKRLMKQMAGRKGVDYLQS